MKQLTTNEGGALTVDDNVVDALIVVRNAVRNAIALASTVLTSRISITLPPKSAGQLANEMMAGRGLRM